MKIASLIIILLMSSEMLSQSSQPKQAETVSVNGKNIHYEIYGAGEPLVLLHGYTQSSHAWKPYVADYEQDYEVYLIDLTGHGQSDPFKQDLSIKSVAKDLEALLHYLELDIINAIGFSFGGDVLYQLALLNDSIIERMVTIGAVGTWSVLDFPDYLAAFTFENRDNFPWLKTSHKGEEQIKAMMEQFANYIVSLNDEELRSIKADVLIMVGDRDEGLSLKEVVRAKENLPNSDLWILPGVAHGAHEGETKHEFINKSKRFLQKN